MDGNRRYAKREGMPAIFGHEKGALKIKEACAFAKEAGVKFLTLFAFSSENWNRKQPEIENLIKLLNRFIENEAKELISNKIKIKIIGDKTKYPPATVKNLNQLENETADFKDFCLIIALNYGGKMEIMHAVNSLLLEGKKEVTEKEFEEKLFTFQIPNPDLLIRTGNSFRISNFLLWQMAYTELYFTDCLWPEFSKGEFEKAVNFYHKQIRNFGK